MAWGRSSCMTAVWVAHRRALTAVLIPLQPLLEISLFCTLLRSKSTEEFWGKMNIEDWLNPGLSNCSGYRLILHISKWDLRSSFLALLCWFFFFLNIYKWRKCLWLKEMQWEEHNLFWLSVLSPQQWETEKIQTNLYFWTNCSKPGAYSKLRVIWCEMKFCHPVFTLLIAPHTSVPSFLLVLPIALSRLLKPVSSSKNYWKIQSFLLT